MTVAESTVRYVPVRLKISFQVKAVISRETYGSTAAALSLSSLG